MMHRIVSPGGVICRTTRTASLAKHSKQHRTCTAFTRCYHVRNYRAHEQSMNLSRTILPMKLNFGDSSLTILQSKPNLDFTPICAYSSKTADKKEERSPFLLAAVYGSFIMGGFLLSAILLREYKRKKLEWRGIIQMKFSEWKRMPVYKYKDFVIPDFVVKNIDDIEKFQTDEKDVWVVSFPRSGTTWLQEIVYLIQTDLDYYTARTEYLDDRFPYFEYIYPGAKEVQRQEAPRMIKSHLPWPIMPESVKEKKPKIIYIARNPKDVVVSFYYFTRLLSPITKYKGKFSEYFDLFIDDKVMYSPWWQHVQQYWELRDEPNVLYLTYEDLKKDTMGTIDKVASFLGKQLSEEQKFKLMIHCSFEAMKANEMTNHRWFEKFGVSDPKEGECMRKGCIGDWANHFTVDMNVRMQQMVEEKLADSGITFSYKGTHFKPEESTEKQSPETQSV